MQGDMGGICQDAAEGMTVALSALISLLSAFDFEGSCFFFDFSFGPLAPAGDKAWRIAVPLDGDQEAPGARPVDFAVRAVFVAARWKVNFLALFS